MPPTQPERNPRTLRSSLLKLAWPVVAEQVLATLANMVDMVIVGRLGAAAIAAVGLSTQPLWLLMGIFLGLATGINALVSRLFGAGDKAGVRRGSDTAFWLGLGLAGVIGAALWTGAPQVARLMGAQPDVAPQAELYLRALVPGLVVLFLSMAMNAALRAVGDTRTSFYINLMVNALNAPLTLALVYGYLGAPAMGVLGAGIATSAARLIGFGVLLAVVLRRFGPIGGFDPALAARIVRVGAPASLERVSSTTGYLIFARLISGLGTVPFAAHHVAIVAENFVWMAAMGLATATAVLVGQSLGARDPDRAQGTIREAARLTAIVIGPIGLAFILFARPYLSVFTDDGAVIAAAVPALRIAGVVELPMALVLVLMAAFQGAGDTRPLLWITLSGAVARVAAAVLFVPVLGLGLPGAWLATWCDWGLRLGLCVWRIRKGRWKEVSV